MGLNALDLDAISQDARDCFLYEDAPEHVAMLEAGANDLHLGDTESLQAKYTDLIRAAHSLKGGAGLAQLPVLSQLAHRLEDLLEALQEQRVSDSPTAHELVTLGIDQVTQLITSATHGRPEPELTELPILQALDEFLETVPEAALEADLTTAPESSGGSSYLTQVALEVDLEDCIQRLEQVLHQTHAPDTVMEALTELVESCSLLGQTLDLDWLMAQSERLEPLLAQPNCPVVEMAIATITELRTLRHQTLDTLSGTSAAPTLMDASPAVLPSDLEESFAGPRR